LGTSISPDLSIIKKFGGSRLLRFTPTNNKGEKNEESSCYHTCTNNCSLTLTNGPYKVHGSGLAENYTVTVDRIYGTEGCFVTLYGSTTASNVVGIATSAYLKLAGDVVLGANDNLMLYFATNNYAIQVGGVTNLD